MRPLTFGYLYDFRNPPQWQRPWQQVYAETLDFIAWSEQAGFDGAWVPEHHLSPDGYMPSPLAMLAAIAARTSTIRIGSGVAIAPLYDPVRFAQDCAVIDQLAGGRLELGLAIGYRAREYAAFGLDAGKRGARFDEFLQIVTRLWAGEEVSFSGKHFAIEGAKLNPLPPRGKVPLHIGGFVDKALERVAKHGDGYYGNLEFAEAYAAKLAAHGKDAASARVMLPALFLTCAQDPEAAMEDIGPHFHHQNNVYGRWMAEDKKFGIEDAALAEMDFDAFRKSGILTILTPGQMIDRLRAMKAKTPALDHFMMCLPPGLPPARFRPYAELFAREVIPAFA
ncbi:MAG TPA: LLM class flavin-dependent oxidoreductase [Novosphingobium sp.]|nr:LLM class flavin-dependent oxidoreductase [Novosphingobium sp.]